ncbi:hypothetical protein KC865_02660, partial [Candidatus Kaiserbacteria bacterium]|nr:hypothetical protein [Candidatus Kaiserbacteria bacterium]
SSYRWLDDRELAGLQTLMSTSNITVFGKNENETLFDRLVMLANRFVDGILSVFELRANRVEVADELCVDDVCVTADDLRALLQDDERLSGGNNNTAVPDTDDNGGATPDVDTDGDYTSTVKDEQQPEEDNIDVPIESVSDDAVAGNSTDGDLGSESTLSTEQTTETEEESTVSESESESETVANEETSIEEAAPGVTTEEPTT